MSRAGRREVVKKAGDLSALAQVSLSLARARALSLSLGQGPGTDIKLEALPECELQRLCVLI